MEVTSKLHEFPAKTCLGLIKVERVYLHVTSELISPPRLCERYK